MSIAPMDPANVRFEDLPEQAWPRHEIIDGRLHVTPLASKRHQFVVTQLAVALARVAPPELAVLAGVNVLRRRTTDRLLIPDVAVIDRESAVQPGPAARPDEVYFAAEVISPSSRRFDLDLKRQLYAEWGIGTYWVLDTDAREVHEFGLRASATCWLAEADLSEIWPDGV